MSSFTEQEIAEFKAEAMDLLDVAEKSLLSLDQGTDFKKAYDAVFRGFHNLKGAAGVMELTRLQEHTHELENLLIQFKKASSMPKSYVDLFLRGIDAARMILNDQAVSFDYSVASLEAGGEVKASEVNKTPDIAPEAVDEFVAETDEIVERHRLMRVLDRHEVARLLRPVVEAVADGVGFPNGGAHLLPPSVSFASFRRCWSAPSVR